jgi:outer membrane protein TolC
MRHSGLGVAVCFVLVFVLPLCAQKEGYSNYATPQIRSGKLEGSQHLRSYVIEGKLRLSLRDAVVLTLENNSEVRVRETQVETSKFSLLGAHGPFDPVLSSVDNINSTTSPPYTFLQGTGSSNVNYKSTTKSIQFNYSQMFESGTTFLGGFNTFINSSNSSFFLFNPYTASTLNFQLTQPLLRNGWFAANRAPLVIARRNLQQSRAAFVAEVNNNILQAVNQYWAVVQARGNLEVAQASMAAAESTYKRDKRALELGALPPLDIYRSESQVASRRVQVIESEYALRQAEDALRLTIGADQDPYFRRLICNRPRGRNPETICVRLMRPACCKQLWPSALSSKLPRPPWREMRRKFAWRTIICCLSWILWLFTPAMAWAEGPGSTPSASRFPVPG